MIPFMQNKVKRYEIMKKSIAFLLAFALILGALTLAPLRSSAALGALGEGEDISALPPEQILQEARANLEAADSVHMDMAMIFQMSMEIVYEGQPFSIPMNILFTYGMDHQKEPMLTKAETLMNMSVMGQEEMEHSILYREELEGDVICYTSNDEGETWTAEWAGETDVSPANTFTSLVNNAESMEYAGTDTVNGKAVAVYTCKLSGQYMEGLLSAAGSSGMGDLMGTDGDAAAEEAAATFEVTMYIDPVDRLPLRYGFDMTAIMEKAMASSMQSLMGMEDMEGVEMQLAISQATADVYLYDFNSIQPIEIPEAARAAEIPPKVQPLVMGTGAETGSYFLFGTILSNVITAHADGALSVEAVSSGGSRGNLDGLVSGEYQLGFVQSDVAASSLAGDEKYADVRALAGLYPIPVQIVTTDPDIKTLADLKGRRIAVGPAGSAVFNTATELLGAAGISINEDVTLDYMSFGDAAEDLKTRAIDAAFLVATVPTNSVRELAMAVPTYLVAVDDAPLEAFLTAHPYYGRCILSKDVYDTETDVQTVAVKTVLLTSASLSEEDAYAILAAIFNNRDEIAAAHDFGKLLDIQTAAEGPGAPLHPGAVKFYTENGVQVPEA